jgi:phosphocarrier protein HPr
MSARFSHRSGPAPVSSHGCEDPQLGFVNPWADCWGSAYAAASDPGQMRAGGDAGRQMEASEAEAPCEESEQATVPAPGGDLLTRVLPIINNKGLHARASAKFVQTVERFDAEVFVSRCGETVGGLSIMGLMMLAAARGTSVTVQTRGRQAVECMDALEALLASRFGEEC